VEVVLGCLSSPCKESKSELIDQAPIMEKTFIYPPEAVLVPMMHHAFSRFSSKRYLLPSLTNCLICKVNCFFIFSMSVYGYLVLLCSLQELFI
jgi:mediator of RNA polymerase II transcription subunit 13